MPKDKEPKAEKSQFGEENFEGSWFHRAVSEGVQYFKGDTGTSIRVMPTLDIESEATPGPDLPLVKRDTPQPKARAPQAKAGAPKPRPDASGSAFAPKKKPMLNTAINEFMEKDPRALGTDSRPNLQPLLIRSPQIYETLAAKALRLLSVAVLLFALIAGVVFVVWLFTASEAASLYKSRQPGNVKVHQAKP